MKRRSARTAGLALVALLGIAVVGVAVTGPPAPPSFDAVRSRYLPSDAWLLDRHGERLETRRIDFTVRRLEWTPLAAVSPALVEAIVRGEDRRFRTHSGVDWLGVAGAARDGLRGRHRGASTIAMQVADLIAGPEERGPRTIAGKLRQMRRALALGRRWSQDQVLEAYLNLLPFRGELQGVRAAAAELAGKSPDGLTKEEADVIAALLPQPGARAKRVAERACARRGGVDCEPLLATASRLLDRGREAPTPPRVEHLAPQLAVRLLSTPGESVRTTLDARVQRVVRSALERQLDGLAARNVRDAAALVVDNASGEVLAYVGSAGTASSAAQVDGVRARRQAGSTLKPFLFALALEQRYLTAASLLDDSPLTLDTASGVYVPRDYDQEFKGAVSVRTALAGSLNVPAVRALMLTGVESFRDRLNAFGYDGIDRDGAWYGFSLALGSAEVSLWEQARAYRALARGGERGDLRLLPGETSTPALRASSAAASFVVADILADRGARAVTFGLDSALATPYWSAVKTGTSKDLRDNWCIGFTPEVTVAVWVGNFEGDSMRGVSGVSGAAPAWREILDALQAGQYAAAPVAPAGLHRQSLRFVGAAEPRREEWFLDGTTPGDTIRSVAPQARLARISNPVNGMVIAIDPDIPAAAQRVPLTADGTAGRHSLLLDDRPVGAAGKPLLWQPTRGAHRLALADADGRVLDRVYFTVR